ncbi:MAG: in-like serine protease [Gemmatimonadetes bacterium]|nr:in-like serine protease [Gemmatimonadota bacterium]
MPFSRRSLALKLMLSASIVALAACSEQAPLAPRADASRTQASQSKLASIGATRRLIALRDGRAAASVIARIHALGGTVTRSHEGAGLVVASGLTDAAAKSLAQHADVSDVLKDRMVQWVKPKALRRAAVTASAAAIASRHRTGTPDDQSGAVFFAQFQWNMRVIRASNVWLLRDGHGQGTTVCDLDSGIDPTHLDLAGKVDLGISTSMVVTEPDVLDYNGHGTFVSSQIATNGIGMASVAPLATLCQVKVLDRTGQGLLSDAIAGVIYATDAKADVINMSFGAYFTTTDPDFEQVVDDFQRAVNYAHKHGVTLVASAGNGDSLGVGINLATDARSLLQIPAQLKNVISVGATAPHAQQPGTFDDIATYSNYGYPGVDVFAPGGDFVQGDVIEDLVLGACSSFSDPGCAGGQTYSLGAGTSYASPLVAGEAAVIESDTPGTRATLDNCIIRSSDLLSRHVPDRIFGFGRVDVLGGIHCRRID